MVYFIFVSLKKKLNKGNLFLFILWFFFCTHADFFFLLKMDYPKQQKSILITGAAGFIGLNLTMRLLQDPRNHVIGVDNEITSGSPLLLHGELELDTNPRYEYWKLDVVHDCQTLFGMLREKKVDEIYHLASIASPPKYKRFPLETMAVNIQGTQNMLELAVRCGGAKFLLTSTSEVYGDPLEHPQTESYYGNVNTMGARSCYDESKRCAETYVYEYRRKYPEWSKKWKVCRIFNTYGPYMDVDDGRVITNMIRQIRDGEPITIYGDGLQTRSFCYVDDMVEGLMALMAHEGEEQGPMNLGNPYTECSILELVETMEKIMGRPLDTVHIEKMENDPLVRRPDISLAQRTLGFSPLIGIEEGLRRTMMT